LRFGGLWPRSLGGKGWTAPAAKPLAVSIAVVLCGCIEIQSASLGDAIASESRALTSVLAEDDDVLWHRFIVEGIVIVVSSFRSCYSEKNFRSESSRSDGVALPLGALLLEQLRMMDANYGVVCIYQSTSVGFSSVA
jgi:hypothetical protein